MRNFILIKTVLFTFLSTINLKVFCDDIYCTTPFTSPFLKLCKVEPLRFIDYYNAYSICSKISNEYKERGENRSELKQSDYYWYIDNWKIYTNNQILMSINTENGHISLTAIEDSILIKYVVCDYRADLNLPIALSENNLDNFDIIWVLKLVNFELEQLYQNSKIQKEIVERNETIYKHNLTESFMNVTSKQTNDEKIDQFSTSTEADFIRNDNDEIKTIKITFFQESNLTDSYDWFLNATNNNKIWLNKTLRHDKFSKTIESIMHETNESTTDYFEASVFQTFIDNAFIENETSQSFSQKNVTFSGSVKIDKTYGMQKVIKYKKLTNLDIVRVEISERSENISVYYNESRTEIIAKRETSDTIIEHYENKIISNGTVITREDIYSSLENDEKGSYYMETSDTVFIYPVTMMDIAKSLNFRNETIIIENSTFEVYDQTQLCLKSIKRLITKETGVTISKSYDYIIRVVLKNFTVEKLNYTRLFIVFVNYNPELFFFNEIIYRKNVNQKYTLSTSNVSDVAPMFIINKNNITTENEDYVKTSSQQLETINSTYIRKSNVKTCKTCPSSQTYNTDFFEEVVIKSSTRSLLLNVSNEIKYESLINRKQIIYNYTTNYTSGCIINLNSGCINEHFITDVVQDKYETFDTNKPDYKKINNHSLLIENKNELFKVISVVPLMGSMNSTFVNESKLDVENGFFFNQKINVKFILSNYSSCSQTGQSTESSWVDYSTPTLLVTTSIFEEPASTSSSEMTTWESLSYSYTNQPANTTTLRDLFTTYEMNYDLTKSNASNNNTNWITKECRVEKTVTYFDGRNETLVFNIKNLKLCDFLDSKYVKKKSDSYKLDAHKQIDNIKKDLNKRLNEIQKVYSVHKIASKTINWISIVTIVTFILIIIMHDFSKCVSYLKELYSQKNPNKKHSTLATIAKPNRFEYQSIEKLFRDVRKKDILITAQIRNIYNKKF